MNACCRPQAPQEGGRNELRGQQSWLDPQLQQQADELERQRAFEQHLQANAPPQQQPPPRRGELGWSPDPAQTSGRAESLRRAEDQQGPNDQGSEGGSWWSSLVGWLPWGRGDQPQTQSGEPHSQQRHDGMPAEAACPVLLLAASSTVWCSQAVLPSCAASSSAEFAAAGTEGSDQAVVKDGQQQGEVVEAIVVPPDLPLEAIAEEVKHSWRLKVRCRPPLSMNQARSCFLFRGSLP